MFAVLAVAGANACAQQTEAQLALAAQNPIAALISLPFQYNYDQNLGIREEGHKNYLNIQPVIPISLNDHWNVISRTIVPLIDLDPGGGAESRSGIGDITQSFFFSPKALTEDGWTWGIGPVVYMDTASNDLGANKWGLGPTGVFLKQANGWTYGALLNHIWSVGGSGKKDINNTFLQPFLTYTTSTHTSFTLQTESTYDWTAEQWSVPVHFIVSQLTKIGGQPIQFQLAARYWADSPELGAHGWGVRAVVTFLFPAAK
ncbi:MAG: transporter [Burkholderiales bacterium]